MLISVDEPYWNSSVAASMSQTYLQHFELLNKSGDVPGAFRFWNASAGELWLGLSKIRRHSRPRNQNRLMALENDVAALQTRLMQTNSVSEREQLLDKLVEYERRLGLAWTKGDARESTFPSTTSVIDESGR